MTTSKYFIELNYITPPQYQGHFIEISFAIEGEQIFRRITNHITGNSEYSAAHIETLIGEYEPQNRPPICGDNWFPADGDIGT